MFILDGISCSFEETGLLIEEKMCTLQELTSRSGVAMKCDNEEVCEEEKMDVVTEKEDGAKDSDIQKKDSENDSLDDFSEYLKGCALGVLFPFSSQDDSEHR